MAESDPEIDTQTKKKSKRRKKISVSVSTLADTPDRIAPVVGYFSSGYNPVQSPSEPPNVRVFRSKKHWSSRLDLVVKPKDSTVEFVGKSYEGEAAVHQPCNYALGVLDKETKTLQIVPIAANKIIRLEPRVMSAPSAKGPSDKIEDLSSEQRRQKFGELTSLYGTKKQRNSDKKFRLLQEQTNDPSAREHLQDDVLKADVNDEALKLTKSSEGPNVPPHDVSAMKPEKAYLLDEIIPKGEREYLFDILELLHSGISENDKFWEENYYPSFVVNRIPKLKQIQNEEEQNKCAVILSYITHLVNFWKLASSRAKSQANIFADATNKYKIPRVVCQKFASLFLDQASNVLSTDKKELVISYILVLTLFADRFRSDHSDISKDLGMMTSGLRLYFLHIGCKQSRDARFGNQPWTLPVPLKFPDLTVKRKRRK